jgi:hypothetical protein
MPTALVIALIMFGIILANVEQDAVVFTLQKIVILLTVGTTLQKRNGLTWMFVEKKSN